MEGVYVVGMRHYGVQELPLGSAYILMHDSDNQFHEYAVAIRECNGMVMRGHVNKMVSRTIWHLLEIFDFLVFKVTNKPQSSRKGPIQFGVALFWAKGNQLDSAEELITPTILQMHVKKCSHQ